MQGKSLNFLSIVFAAALIHIPLPYSIPVRRKNMMMA
jgi:hypothetical protein